MGQDTMDQVGFATQSTGGTGFGGGHLSGVSIQLWLPSGPLGRHKLGYDGSQSFNGGGHDGSVGFAIQSTGATVFGGGQDGLLGVFLQSTLEVDGLNGRSVGTGDGCVGGFPSVGGGLRSLN